MLSSEAPERLSFTFYARKRGALGVASQAFAVVAESVDDAWRKWEASGMAADWEPLRFGGAFNPKGAR